MTSFNLQQNTTHIYDKAEENTDIEYHIKPQKSILKKEKETYDLDIVDTKEINLYELEIISKLPWLTSYKNTYIKTYDTKDEKYYNEKEYIVKDRITFYLAKPQFYELLSHKNCEIVFNSSKNLLTISKISLEGDISISCFSLCYHVTGKYDKGKFYKEDIYIFQSQIYKNEIIWRRMNNITKEEYLKKIFDENYEKNNLEDYEIKSFKKISNDLFSTLENVFGIDNLLDHVFNITNTPYEYTNKLMNIYICLVYRKEPYIFEENKIKNTDILPILPMLEKADLDNIDKDIQNSIIDYKNKYYDNIFPKKYMYKSDIDISDNSINIEVFSNKEQLNNLNNFLLRNEIVDDRIKELYIQFDTDLFNQITSELYKKYNITSDYFNYKDENYIMFPGDKGTMYPFNIQVLKDQFLTNKINNYDRKYFTQSFINKIQTFINKPKSFINIKQRNSFEINYMVRKFISYINKIINEEETNKIYKTIYDIPQNNIQKIISYQNNISPKQSIIQPNTQLITQPSTPLSTQPSTPLSTQSLSQPSTPLSTQPNTQSLPKLLPQQPLPKQLPQHTKEFEIKSIKYNKFTKEFDIVKYDSYKNFETDTKWDLLKVESKFKSA